MALAPISFKVEEKVKDRIEKLVKDGRYRHVSDFMHRAIAAEHEVTIQVPAEYRDLKADLSGKLAIQNEINNGLTAKTLRMETRIDDLESLSREQARVIETLFDLTREAERAMPREPPERA